MITHLKYVLTGAVVLIAAALLLYKYWDYVVNPWTRNGQVRAQVIQITPRVSGPLVKLPVKDNQLVKAGDLLFEIDPRTFVADLEQARAELDNTRDEIDALGNQVEAAQADVAAAEATVKQAEAAVKGYAGRVEEALKEYKRQQTLDKQGATSKRAVEEAKANWVSYVNRKANADAQLLQMQASLSEAKANLAKAKADLVKAQQLQKKLESRQPLTA
jgi:multidrug resistance efflux pump